jgi:hypothetical protein
MGREDGSGVEGHAAIPSLDSDQVANGAGATARLHLSRPQAGVEPGLPSSVPIASWIPCPGPAGLWPCSHPDGLGHEGDHQPKKEEKPNA